MKYIRKSPAGCPELEAWKQAQLELWERNKQEDPNVKLLDYNYERFRDVTLLQVCLLEEQGFICCYCCKFISSTTSHVEHFIAQKDKRYSEEEQERLSLEYDNMLASCGPLEKQEKYRLAYTVKRPGKSSENKGLIAIFREQNSYCVSIFNWSGKFKVRKQPVDLTTLLPPNHDLLQQPEPMEDTPIEKDAEQIIDRIKAICKITELPKNETRQDPPYCAKKRGNTHLDVSPLDINCESYFTYDDQGEISPAPGHPRTAEIQHSISELRLNDKALCKARIVALQEAAKRYTTTSSVEELIKTCQARKPDQSFPAFYPVVMQTICKKFNIPYPYPQ
ncbi:hypothetical protein [Prochlorothrix hollandica]|uniref:hypothetical protein n=1 Tax=Prochlorothrix hollandica TaxID=1223 RepID=UPI0033403ED5